MSARVGVMVKKSVTVAIVARRYLGQQCVLDFPMHRAAVAGDVTHVFPEKHFHAVAHVAVDCRCGTGAAKAPLPEARPVLSPLLGFASALSNQSAHRRERQRGQAVSVIRIVIKLLFWRGANIRPPVDDDRCGFPVDCGCRNGRLQTTAESVSVFAGASGSLVAPGDAASGLVCSACAGFCPGVCDLPAQDSARQPATSSSTAIAARTRRLGKVLIRNPLYSES